MPFPIAQNDKGETPEKLNGGVSAKAILLSKLEGAEDTSFYKIHSRDEMLKASFCKQLQMLT
jgi:hypothetical protein